MDAFDLIELERERFAWSLETFPEATDLSSLEKLNEEIGEIENNIGNDITDDEEYADALMCIFDSAGRNGINIAPIIIDALDLLECSFEDFCKETALSNLHTLREAIKIIKQGIENGDDAEQKYAQAIMCLLCSAGMHRISIEQIIMAFAKKLEKNKKRKWVKNPNNTYSHVK